jgi:hypothetical protein
LYTDHSYISDLLKSIKYHVTVLIRPFKAFALWFRSLGTLLLYLIEFAYIAFTGRKERGYFYNVKERFYLKNIIRYLKRNRFTEKNIILFTVHFGEAYFFANLARHIKLQYKNSLFVTAFYQTYAMFKLLAPDDCQPVKLPFKPFQLREHTYHIHDFTIKVLVPHTYWLAFWRKTVHWVNAIEGLLGMRITNNMIMPPRITEEVSTVVEQKCIMSGIHTEKYVIFFTGTNSGGNIPDYFWMLVYKGLLRLGYDIVLNLDAVESPPYLPNAKCCFLPLDELYILVKKSYGIIAVRSGIIEYLCSLPVPKHIVYPVQTVNNPHIINLFENYTFSLYPFADKTSMFEYQECGSQSIGIIAEQIIEYFYKINFSQNANPIWIDFEKSRDKGGE